MDSQNAIATIVAAFIAGFFAIIVAIINKGKKPKTPKIPRIVAWLALVLSIVLIISFVYFRFNINVQCTSSSYQNIFGTCWRCTCDKAFDNNIDTRWASAWTDNEWIVRDLGKPELVAMVVLNWELAYGKSYTIDVSDNGTSWTTVYTQTNGAGGEETIHFSPTMARFIRMHGISRGLPYGYSLWEFRIYATTNP